MNDEELDFNIALASLRSVCADPREGRRFLLPLYKHFTKKGENSIAKVISIRRYALLAKLYEQPSWKKHVPKKHHKHVKFGKNQVKYI